jgi:hypothetical protein
VDELVIPTPTPDPGDFVDRIDNPWLPLAPGNQWVYASTTNGGDDTITTSVLDRTQVVAGVTTTVVHDVETDGQGRVVRDTFDWYAQDEAGNVWYFGSNTTSYDGRRASTAGSWEAGVGGAMAGVVMLAAPRLGDGYQQQHVAGIAEDRATVLSLRATADVPYGAYRNALQIEETSPLEPDLIEHKVYVEGVGEVREQDVAGGVDLVELVSFTKG